MIDFLVTCSGMDNQKIPGFKTQSFKQCKIISKNIANN